MSQHPSTGPARWTGPAGLTRRHFLQLLGTTAGGGAAITAMGAWGQVPTGSQSAPPQLEGNGAGAKVIILGGGPGGCPAAWELMQAGYDVTVLEARDRLGGHTFTVRGGSKSSEYGKGDQVCDWDDENMWYDAGPSRVPFFHRGFIHYCNLFNIPLIDHKNISLNNWVYAENVAGPLNGTKMRLGNFQADMGGYTAELLAKAANQDALDLPMTAEDRDLLTDYLIHWGILSASDLTYGPSDHRGYRSLPGTLSDGELSTPYPLQDLLPFAAGIMDFAGGYLAATAQADWHTTMVKPKGGFSQLYDNGFQVALGDRVRLNCEVTEIRQSEEGVRIVYLEKATGQTQEITGDYCMCNIPLSVLIKIRGDFSGPFRTAMQSVPYYMALRAGLGFKRRFWEEDDWIYGGQSFTNIGELGIVAYPDEAYGAAKGTMLGMYAFGTNAAHVSSLSYAERIELALTHGSKIHPQMREEFMSGFSVAWHLEPYSLGAWPSYTERTRRDFMPTLQEPDGRIYLVGDHLSYGNGWIEAAIQASWMQVEKLHARVLQA